MVRQNWSTQTVCTRPKRRLTAPHGWTLSAIIEALGQHQTYVEPFCGSAAVLFAKKPAKAEIVNDLNADLVHLARMVQSEAHAVELYARCSRTLLHEHEFRECCQVIRTTPAPLELSVERAWQYLVCSWQGMNGVAGIVRHKGGFCVRWSPSGGSASIRWQSVTESIPAWFERLRGVTILSRDAFDVIDGLTDAEGTAIYADPPYLTKKEKYLHDFEPEDHLRLATALRRFTKTRVVVSYYEHEKLKDLYPGWTKINCSAVKNMSNTGKVASVAPEVLLVNYVDLRLF